MWGSTSQATDTRPHGVSNDPCMSERAVQPRGDGDTALVADNAALRLLAGRLTLLVHLQLVLLHRGADGG